MELSIHTDVTSLTNVGYRHTEFKEALTKQAAELKDEDRGAQLLYHVRHLATRVTTV
jgi:hypothetical protein